MIETKDRSACAQNRPQLRQLELNVLSDRTLNYAVLAVAAYALLRSGVYALIKPLWFDEVLTFVVSRQGSLPAIWSALKQGTNGNPPAFYLAEHLVAFGYGRLPPSASSSWASLGRIPC